MDQTPALSRAEGTSSRAGSRTGVCGRQQERGVKGTLQLHVASESDRNSSCTGHGDRAVACRKARGALLGPASVPLEKQKGLDVAAGEVGVSTAGSSSGTGHCAAICACQVSCYGSIYLTHG